MKTLLALRCASLAIAMSLAGNALAQDTGGNTVQTSPEKTKGPKGKTGDAHDGSTGDTGGNTGGTTGDTGGNTGGTDEGTNSGDTAPIVEGTVTSTRETSTNGPRRYGNINPFAVDPNYRDINPFYRDINAFWGNINPFYRDINPFYRDINPFYGDIVAFWGNINPFYRDIVAFDSAKLEALGDFWQTTGTQVEVADTMWAQLQYSWDGTRYRLTYDGTPNKILAELEVLIAQAEVQFGAAYEAETGNSFRGVFVTEFFARHGVNLDDKVSLAGLSAADRAILFLDWHDSLMQFSGIDHVDHWMSAVNWTPAITQIQGSSSRAIVGIIDSEITGGGTNVVQAGTSGADLNGHGAGVVSLINAPHDGEGVMGIAPGARVTAYNPFDADGTASWDDIADGIIALESYSNTALDSVLGRGNRASVINMSLGESGWTASQGLADVLSRPEIRNFSQDTVYVIAAGNDGIAQATDINWAYSTDRATGARVSANSVIFVGSVDPTGQISNFSNTPGSACLLDNGVCRSGNELMNNFIVAPGEMILVSDGQGGVVRRSGTSFAAPLVSGAITLLHDFWPWLADHPEETAEIIFRSARDLGAPGVDPVYGWGMLDVAASQSPLDFNNLEIWLYQRSGTRQRSHMVSASELATSGVQSWWETSNVFFTMFEDIGDTWRDFQVPMSSATYGTRSGVLGEMLYMQDFISARFSQWLNSGGADHNGDGILGITQVNSDRRDLSNGWGLRYDAVMPRFTDEGLIDLVHSAATLQDPSGKLSLTVGHGEGAMALTGGDGFGLVHDYDRFTGGVNPILGFASGEAFMEGSYKLGKRTKVSLGYTENRQTAEEVPGISDAERYALRALKPHTASAMTLSLEHQLTPAISLGGQWTRLQEDEALLGVQSTLPEGLNRGSVTNAVTLSAHVDLGSGVMLDLSSTGARTGTRDGQVFAAGQDIVSTAGQIAISKHRVFGKNDKLRVSFAQPLSVEAGTIEFTSLEVVDRQTGETGPVTQNINLGTKRRLSGEILYGAKLGNSTQLGLFGHYLTEGNPGEEKSFVVGANIGWRF